MDESARLDEVFVELRKRYCEHIWPMSYGDDDDSSYYEPDAHCLKGCGATYELWGDR